MLILSAILRLYKIQVNHKPVFVQVPKNKSVYDSIPSGLPNQEKFSKLSDLYMV